MVVTEDGHEKLVKLDAQGKPISKSVISAKDAAKMDPVTKERIDLLKERYKAAMEFGAEESEISKIASELDELTGKKQEGPVSLVDGYTADQVIELFMKRNNISREQAISLARQQGRIQ